MITGAWVNLWIARPGQGKGLAVARVINSLFKEYRLIEKKFPELPKRILYSNMKLSKGIDSIELIKDIKTSEVGVRHLSYWDKLDTLRYCQRSKCWRGIKIHALHDVDLVIDELPDYCPADNWTNLPRWARKMFSQHRHRGIRIYATAQDYKMVDINFRRMIGVAYEVQKMFGSRDISATLPPVKRVWGMIKVFRFDPRALEMDSFNSDTLKHIGYPRFFLITRKLVDMYDTTQDLPEWRPMQLEHLQYECLDPNCYTHKGRPIVEHRKV